MQLFKYKFSAARQRITSTCKVYHVYFLRSAGNKIHIEQAYRSNSGSNDETVPWTVTSTDLVGRVKQQSRLWEQSSVILSRKVN